MDVANELRDRGALCYIDATFVMAKGGGLEIGAKMPVSETANSTKLLPLLTLRAASLTSPALVNLQALLNKLSRICRSRMGSTGQRAEVLLGVNDEAVLVLLGELSRGADDLVVLPSIAPTASSPQSAAVAAPLGAPAAITKIRHSAPTFCTRISLIGHGGYKCNDQQARQIVHSRAQFASKR